MLASSSEKDLRDPNISDACRFLAALCVIWYHNPLYWQLRDYTSYVDVAKLIFLGWSMPFFYLSTAKHAFNTKKFEHLLRKVLGIIFLIFIYTVIYDLFGWNAGGGIVDVCFNNDQYNICSIKYLFDRFREVAGTPGLI